ncbi:phage tail tape measure protein [Arthrobacter sp. NPDC097144]|uniref:phage tail tape measure protein n=1 Tax=Arthrobacter sp. NPDC097144 TaxID=3363946 RepID=UPI003824B04C
MTTRSVIVELQARVGSYISDFGKAKQSTDQLAQAQDKAGRSVDQAAQAQDKAAGSADKSSQSTKRSAAALAEEAAAAQNSAKALGLQYNASGQLTDANGKVLSSSQAAAQGMGQFSDAVYLTAHAAEEAGDSAGKATSGLDRLADSAEKNRDAWDKAGGTLTAFGVSTVAVLGATAKAAMDWQSAWAGVTKTVDGSPEQMAELEDGLRGLAKTLPITHAEIAGVAEAAGQLGVARKDVLGFTKTMVDLGVSTNLTAEEAATDIAQISNVMGTMSREGAQGVARFGSALVALGNDGASTEKEILSMAQRIAGAGATVGATEVEVLALSNTLASMGIRAELGGGVTTRVLLKMFTAVKEGGETLGSFAKAAGVSADEFSKAYSESPVKALDMVAQGLNRVNQDGGNVVEVMKDLGIKGTEEIQVMLSLANSGTLLADSLALGSKAWSENTALIEEATKRYDTADSKVRIAWNNIKDAAISAGAVLLPVIAGIADGVSDLAGFFGDLPAPVQGALTVLGGMVGVSALLAGGFLVLFPRVMDVVGAFKTLGVSGGNLGGKMKTLGKAMGIASVVMAAVAAVTALHNAAQPAAVSTGELTQALLGLKKNSGSLDDVFAGLKSDDTGRILADVNNVGEALEKLKNPGVYGSISSFGATVLNVDNDTAKLLATFSTMDQTLAGAVSSGNFEQASAGFKSIAESAAKSGYSLEETRDAFPVYIESLRELASAAGETVSEQDILKWAMGEIPAVMQDAAAATDGAAVATDGMTASEEAAAAASEEFVEAMEEIGLSTDGTITSLEKFADALFAAGLATMSSRDAAFGWEQTLRGLDGQVAEVVNSQAELGSAINATGTDFNLMTDSGASANAVFQDIIKEGLGVAQTFSGDLSKSAADINQQLHDTYDAGVAANMGLGLSEEAAIALTREALKIPRDVSIETWMDEEALRLSGNLGTAVEEIPQHIQIQTSMDEAAFNTAGATKASAEDVPDQVTIDSWMADEAFIEAIRTRAAAEGIPPDVAVASFMESAARNEADETTAQILKIPKGASVTSYMDAYARAEAQRLTGELNAIDGRNVTATATFVRNEVLNNIIHTIRTGENAPAPSGPGSAGYGVLAGQATGGRVDEIPGFPTGGRVPGQRSANVGKDNVLAMVDGKPLGLEGTEWVINPNSSDRYDKELAAINAGSFPKGTLSGASFGREYAAPAPTYGVGGTGAIPSTVSLHPEDRALLQAVAAAADRPFVATLNGRELITAHRRAEQTAKQGA